MKDSFPTSELKSLTDEQLDQNLRNLQQRGVEDAREIDELHTAVQELQVHRIQLEMQNRALRDTQAELECAVQRYADLYDNLPLAYLTLTTSGQIVGANRAAREWFRCESRGLVGRYIGSFLDPYDAGRFAAHLDLCVQNGGAATIELTLRPGDGQLHTVQFASRRAVSIPGVCSGPLNGDAAE